MANYFSDSKFEDSVQCTFFSIVSTNLEQLCKAVNASVTALSKDYIWHRDELKISVSVSDEAIKGLPAHLTSTTNFGDNIEDEWFIVYLVLKITSEYTDLVVQIEDDDGDFLLIEAADFLPSWANPDSTKNRVFIYQSKIHLIPPEVVKLGSNLDLREALDLVVQKADETKAANEIQEAIWKRVSLYPQKIKESHHKATVTLPIDIAALLTLKPTLISPLVTSFCNHDMLDAKCFKNIKFQHCVTIPITFTKYQYAMLMCSMLPKISKSETTSKDNVLGIKLACGYEIIMSKLSDDIFNSSQYNRFLNRLTNNGYFKDNIKGSKQYNELLLKARDYFTNTECPIISYYCHHISNVKASVEFKNIRDLLNNRSNESQADDDDQWLNINPDELNTFLNTHYGKKLAENQASTTSQVTSELANFFKKTSDFEGIEYTKEEESNSNNIEFDTDEFIKSIENMLNLVSGKEVNVEDSDDEFCDDDEDMEIEESLEKELMSKLNDSDTKSFKNENIVKNLVQSIKEEGISGPSSNLLNNIDIESYRSEND